jgi:hypothetical protein
MTFLFEIIYYFKILFEIQDRTEEGGAEERAIELDIDASAPQPEATNSGSQRKRRWGRIVNLCSEMELYVITKVMTGWEILESKHFRARWCNAIGALVRHELNPAVRSWKDISVEAKDFLWKKLLTNFRFFHAFNFYGLSY